MCVCVVLRENNVRWWGEILYIDSKECLYMYMCWVCKMVNSASSLCATDFRKCVVETAVATCSLAFFCVTARVSMAPPSPKHFAIETAHSKWTHVTRVDAGHQIYYINYLCVCVCVAACVHCAGRRWTCVYCAVYRINEEGESNCKSRTKGVVALANMRVCCVGGVRARVVRDLCTRVRCPWWN